MSFRNRNFRKKASDDHASEEALGRDEEEAGAGFPTAAGRKDEKDKKKDKKKDKNSKSASGLLSFEEEAEDDAPALKLKKKLPKSSNKAKLAATVPPPSKPTEKGTQHSAPGEYTAEKLRALQKNAINISTARLAPPPQPDDGESPAHPLIKLSGSFKPAGSVAPRSPVYSPERQVPDATVAREVDVEEEMPLPPPPRQSSGSAAGAVPPTIDDSEEEDQDDLIPDAETIRKAKERRERLRRAHGAEDYISVHDSTGTAALDLERAARCGGRSSGSESEDEGDRDTRMQFIGAHKDRNPGTSVLSAAADPTTDPDHEDDSWIDEQIRKGTGASSMFPTVSGKTAAAPGRPTQAAGGRGSIEEQAASVMASLRQHVERLSDKKKMLATSLRKTKQSLQDSIASVSSLEEQLVSGKDKFAVTQEVKAYVADLCDCLQDKSAIIDVLEGHLEEVVQGRVQAASENRRLHAEEGSLPLEAAVSTALQVLSEGGSTESAAQRAAAAEAAAQSSLETGLREELDEFGRDLNVQKRKDLQKRLAQRARRRQVLAERQRKAAALGRREAVVGESASGESDEDVEHYARRRTEIATACQTVFKDADEDFSTVAAVKKRLEDFKARFPASYQQAYLPASAPALFAPFVRLELLRWDILHQPVAGSSGRQRFDSHTWYTQLFDYGMGEGCTGEEDEDNQLVPQIVKKILLPHVIKVLRDGWDALNPMQSSAARDVAADLLVYVDPSDKAVADLLQVVLGRLTEAAAGCRVPAWPPAAAAACPAAAEVQSRSFGSLVRVIRIIGAWEGVIARKPLQELALKQLSAQAVPYIRAAGSDAALGVERLERAVAAVPGEWFPTGGPPPREAAPLLGAAEALARTVESKRMDGPWKSERPKVAGRLAHLLTRLGSPDRAANMAYLSHLPT